MYEGEDEMGEKWTSPRNQTRPEAAKFGDKPFPLYHKLSLVFGKDRATGSQATDVGDDEVVSETQENALIDLEDDDIDTYVRPSPRDVQNQIDALPGITFEEAFEAIDVIGKCPLEIATFLSSQQFSIEGLEKVKNATEACEADLSRKRLTELEVKWSDVSDASRKDTTENDVLDALKPYNDSLKRLSIVKYLGLEFPKWCTSLPPLGQLPSLKRLYIQNMDDVKDVGLEFLGTGVAFPSLEILWFQGMPGWEVWSTNSRSGIGDSVFPRLQELHIEYCPNLVEFSLEGDSVFPSLQELCIRYCPNLVSLSLKAPLLSLRDLSIYDECGAGLLRSLVHAAPSVTKLEISYISGLTNEVWGGVILDLKAVEELEVTWCNEIRYLWESNAEASSKVLVNLRKLKVDSCKNLVSLGEKDEEYNYGSNLLTSLRSLEISFCENFKHLSCPNNIETSVVVIQWLEELGEGGEKNKLLINSKSMPMLEIVSIIFHPNVASIIEFEGNFIHLTSLRIEGCKSTAESLFADLQLPSLTSITDLRIVDCPSMDAPTGLWPPNLRNLTIGQLKKPISEWGPQKFPTTLVKLTLIGEGATNWSQLSHLHIPSSLTSLQIWRFDNLETVSEGLQHLTSLQFLNIEHCPKIKDLPETLLPSLLHLYISDCPNLKELPVALLRPLLSLCIWRCPGLKERCSRGGSHWPQISHIPKIEIDFESQT
ncbi:NB-ARC domains-containing protein [Tanacetum coccineum]